MRSSCAKKMSVSLGSLKKCKGGSGVMEKSIEGPAFIPDGQNVVPEIQYGFLIQNNTGSILGLQRTHFEKLSFKPADNETPCHKAFSQRFNFVM
jgi:hypothetical protein